MMPAVFTKTDLMHYNLTMSTKANPIQFSVLILHWRAEQYLQTCLEAMDAQTYKDFEVLLLDNGNEIPLALDFADDLLTCLLKSCGRKRTWVLQRGGIITWLVLQGGAGIWFCSMRMLFQIQTGWQTSMKLCKQIQIISSHRD